MPFDLVIRRGMLIDGTGAPRRPADIGVEGDRITAVGDLVVNGRIAVRDGAATGARFGRPLRRDT